MKKDIVTVIKKTSQKCIQVLPELQKCSLVWLHGMGGQAQRYVPFWKHRNSAVMDGCRVTLLQAPERWVTLMQTKAPSWYDVKTEQRFTRPPQEVFSLGEIEESRKVIDEEVRKQVEYWREKEGGEQKALARKVFVGGMSQGGAVSLHYALSSPLLLGGAISLSGYLLPTTPLKSSQQLPLLLVHGADDQHILEADAKQTYSPLIEKDPSHRVDYHNLPDLGHEVCMEQIGMIRKWMKTWNELYELELP